MRVKFILTDYIEQAMTLAVYEKLEDDTFGATIPPCWGVIAFGNTAKECHEELRSVLEDWILTGLVWGDTLPVLNGIDLNVEVPREPVESL